MSTDDQITLVVFSSFELICVVVLLIAGVKMLRTYARSRRLVRVQGTVVAHQEHQTTMRGASGYGSRNVTLQKPVVRFSTPSGQEIDVLHPVSSSVPPAIGSKLPVDVDPRRPEKAQVASALARYLAPGVTFAAVGLVLIILVSVELSILR